MKKYTCPICGYDGLEDDPYQDTFEICPCCGYEFGAGENFDKHRHDWLKNGAKWWAKDERKPKNWDLIKQLNNIQNYVFERYRKRGEFLEFQLCEKEENVKSVKHWQESSLFVWPENPLFEKYLALLQNALLSNGEVGFDESGINYYSHEKTVELYNKILKDENLPDRKFCLNG